MESSRELNEIMYLKDLEKCPVYNKHSINVN